MNNIPNFIYSVGYDGLDVADLETSKHLKSLGFNEPTYYYWLDTSKIAFVERGLKRVKMNKRRMNHNKYDEFIYSAPTKEQTNKFLKSI
jgi:hypothetical protein